MPHMHGDEYLAFERLHQIQHKAEQQQQVPFQRKQYLNSLQRFLMRPWHLLHRSQGKHSTG